MLDDTRTSNTSSVPNLTRFGPILAAALAAFLAPSALAAVPGDFDVVRVNGTPIRQSEVLERLWKRHGSQTLEEMIDELLLRQAAVAKKITAPSSEVDRRFSRLQAQFGTKEMLISQLEQAGTTIAKVKEDLAEEIVRERLVIESKGLKVSDAELKTAYDANKEKMGKPESAHLLAILTRTEAEAKDIVAKIKGGADFKALAREKSESPSGKATSGDYGFISRGMLPPELDEAAFSLKPGEIKIIAGPRAWHILKVLERRPFQPATFDEAKEELRELMLADKLKEASGPFLLELRRKADIKTPGQPKPAATKK